MTDRNDDWWNAPGTPSPPPSDSTDDASSEPDETPTDSSPPTPPADATTVLPSSSASAPSAPNYGHAPPQQTPQPPPGPSYGAPTPAPPPPPQQQYPQQAYGQPPGAPPQYGQQPYPQQGYGAPPFAAPPYGQAPATGRRRGGGVIFGALTMFIGAGLALLGTLLPWLTFDGFGDEPNGFESYPFGDDFDPVVWTNPGAYVLGAFGIVTLLAIIVLAAGKATWNMVLSILATVGAGAVSFAAFVVMLDVSDRFGLDIGPGIIIVCAAAFVAFVGSLIAAIAR